MKKFLWNAFVYTPIFIFILLVITFVGHALVGMIEASEHPVMVAAACVFGVWFVAALLALFYGKDSRQ